MPYDIKGKTAIVTGAGSGINLAFALLLLKGGCNVVIGDLALRPEAEEALRDYRSQAAQTRAVFVKTNVVIWKQLENLFEQATAAFGSVDIVCPGAGVFEPHWTNFWHPPGSKESTDVPLGGGGEDDGVGHYSLLDINLVHPIRMTQLAMSHWLNASGDAAKVSPSNPKRVVHIASIASQVPNFTAPMYCASKAGLSNFIRSVAKLDELGIRVNGVAPGVIKTPLWLDHPEKLRMLNLEHVEWVEPEEVAVAMLRCCVDDDMPGGTILEVLKDATRKVDWRNDPGPDFSRSTVNSEITHADVFAWLSQPGWGKKIQGVKE